MNTTLARFPGARGRAGLLALCTVGAAFIAGCASEPDSHVVSAPPPPPPPAAPTPTPLPVTITTQPGGGAAATQSTILIQQAPPATQTEVVTAQPSPRHVWIAGYWTYRESRYVWIAGHWEVPPASGAVWIAPHGEPEAGGYRFYEGHWSTH